MAYVVISIGGLFIVPLASANAQTAVPARNVAGTVTFQSSVAIGAGSNSVGVGNVSIGQGASVIKNNGSAANYSVAIGRNAKSSGSYGTSVGQSSSALGDLSAAFGNGALAEGRTSIAFGSTANASSAAAASIAIGSSASVTAANSVALGAGSSITQANSVAIGAHSVADQGNTVSVGSVDNQRRITNVAAGTSATDAANYGQVQAVTTDLNDFKQETRSGIAATAAMVNPVMPSAPGKISVAANMATYHGEMGIGTAFAYRPTVSATIVHGGFGLAGNETVARVGVSTEF